MTKKDSVQTIITRQQRPHFNISKMPRYSLILFLLLLFVSCEKESTWPLQSGTADYIVVDGTITNENKIQVIRLSRPVSLPNDLPLPVSGANLIVSSSDQVVAFSEDPLDPGTYVSDEIFAGKTGREYSLFISLNGHVITAKASMVTGNEFIFLRYARQNSTKLFRIIWVANPFNAKRPAMYEILLDWSSVPGYENANPETTRARLLYYSLPTLDVSQIFAPAMESVLFPPGTLITEKKYSLTMEHAEYIRALLSETNWQGGLFNSAPASLPTNLSSNGIGYFGACAVTSKTDVAKNILPVALADKANQ